jgi:hypothetical protein
VYSTYQFSDTVTFSLQRKKVRIPHEYEYTLTMSVQNANKIILHYSGTVTAHNTFKVQNIEGDWNGDSNLNTSTLKHTLMLNFWLCTSRNTSYSECINLFKTVFYCVCCLKTNRSLTFITVFQVYATETFLSFTGWMSIVLWSFI